MKNLLTLLLLGLPLLASAQFSQMEKSGITIIVTDGTYDSQHSPQRAPGDAKYTDPIRSLGMVDAIQAGAFTTRPKYGKFGFLLVFIIQRKKWKATEFNLGFLFFMFVESVVWSAGLFSIMNFSNQVALMNPNTRFLIQRVVLSIGAGIYEEFVFRLLFIGGFTYLIGFVLQWKQLGRKIGAVVLSAVIFSLFHFVGVLGDQPDVGLFFVRFVAGLFLGGLYCFRGFGITACTHALYDLILLVMVVT